MTSWRSWWPSCYGLCSIDSVIRSTDSINEESLIQSDAHDDALSSLNWSISSISADDDFNAPIFPPRQSASFGFPELSCEGKYRTGDSSIISAADLHGRILLLGRLKARARRKFSMEDIDAEIMGLMLGKFMLDKFLCGFFDGAEESGTDIVAESELLLLCAYLDSKDVASLEDIENQLNHLLEIEDNSNEELSRKLDSVLAHWWLTVQWRMRRRPHEITLESTAAVAHRCYLNGYDRLGRPVMYLKLYTESTSADPVVNGTGEVDHEQMMVMLEARVLCMMEHALKILSAEDRLVTNCRDLYPGIVLIVDCNHQGSMALAASMTSTSLRAILEQMSTHYPEMLYRSWIVGAPFAVRMAWHVVQSWIHPITRAKIQFVEPAVLQAPAQQSLLAWSGTIKRDKTAHDRHRSHRKSHLKTNSKNPILALVNAECLELEYGGLMRFEINPELYADQLRERCNNQDSFINNE